jgi:hypothetical protein
MGECDSFSRVILWKLCSESLRSRNHPEPRTPDRRDTFLPAERGVLAIASVRPRSFPKCRVTVDLRGRRPYVSRTPNRSHRTIGRPSRSRIPLVSGVQLHLERYRARLPQAAVAGYLPVSALLAQSR